MTDNKENAHTQQHKLYEKYKNHPALNPPAFYNPTLLEQLRDYFIQVKLNNEPSVRIQKEKPAVLIFLFSIAFIICISFTFVLWNIMNTETKKESLSTFSSNILMENQEFINYLEKENQFLEDERQYKKLSPHLFTSDDNNNTVNKDFYIRNPAYFDKVISLSVSPEVSEDEAKILRNSAANYAFDLLKAQQELSKK